MHEKMTDEALGEVFRKLDNKGCIGSADLLRAHIAALTAEREAVARLAVDRGAELDALRERVQALEEELRKERSCYNKQYDRANAAERTLAAIRQRAGDASVALRWFGAWESDAFARAWGRWSRYVVGENASCACPDFPRVVGDDCPKHLGSAPQTDDLAAIEQHRENEEAKGERLAATCAVPIECEHGFDVCPTCDGKRGSTSPTEPTTAEAFAAVNETLDEYSDRPAAKRALSLLERRMGAQDRGMRKAMAEIESEDGDPWMTLKSVLTDAPPVFTLEEVRAAMDDWCNREQLDEVSKRLSALRKVTP